MSFAENLKKLRKENNLSQEELAEMMDVSRQAVTKWENGKSAPSTEKLFKLAELFGTTVDLMLPDREDNQADRKAKKRYLTLRSVLFAVIWYLQVFLIGFGIESLGCVERKYLIFWLLSSGVYWISFAVVLVLAVIGWRRVSLALDIACLVGLLAGEVFGPNPEGASVGFGHYGWAIWIAVMLAGLIAGMLWQIYESRKQSTSE
jgi:transcriptional regulator with XRE-family HTH domain